MYGRVFGVSITQTTTGLFENLNMLYTPKGATKAEPNGVHLTVFHFICLGKVIWGFKNTEDQRPFSKLEKVLSPDRVCEGRTLVRPYCVSYALSKKSDHRPLLKMYNFGRYFLGSVLLTFWLCGRQPVYNSGVVCSEGFRFHQYFSGFFDKKTSKYLILQY